MDPLVPAGDSAGVFFYPLNKQTIRTMPQVTSQNRIESYFSELFKGLYGFDLEFDARRKTLDKDKGNWGHDDMADIVERKLDFLKDHFADEDDIPSFMQNLRSAPHSLWTEENTQNRVLYQCPDTEYHTLTFNETRDMIPCKPGQIATMIPSLKYIDFVVPVDGKIVIVGAGRESPDWLEAFESFHGEKTTATGPRVQDMEQIEDECENREVDPEDDIDRIDCPFCGKMHYQGSGTAAAGLWTWDESEVCEHLLFLALDLSAYTGFQYRSKLFNQHLGLPDSDDGEISIPSEDNPEDDLSVIEIIDKISLPGLELRSYEDGGGMACGPVPGGDVIFGFVPQKAN